MAVINYQNLPSTSTPLNATNLNAMQNISETGSNTDGYYIKYDDGTLICYVKSKNLGQQTFTSTGSLYSATISNPFTFPISFINDPVVSITTQATTDYAYGMIYGVIKSTSAITEITILRPTTTNGNVWIGYIAIGRWKS